MTLQRQLKPPDVAVFFQQAGDSQGDLSRWLSPATTSERRQPPIFAPAKISPAHQIFADAKMRWSPMKVLGQVLRAETGKDTGYNNGS